MRTDKLSAERIREILALVDELKASGVSAEAFAQRKGISYGQIRGWLSRACLEFCVRGMTCEV